METFFVEIFLSRYSPCTHTNTTVKIDTSGNTTDKIPTQPALIGLMVTNIKVPNRFFLNFRWINMLCIHINETCMLRAIIKAHCCKIKAHRTQSLQRTMFVHFRDVTKKFQIPEIGKNCKNV